MILNLKQFMFLTKSLFGISMIFNTFALICITKHTTLPTLQMYTASFTIKKYYSCKIT